MARADTRQMIIDTASDLFYERGYNLVGINEIIEKSGIAKATLYNHFKSKEDICLAYLDFRDNQLLNDIEDFCQKKPKGDKRLIGVLEFLLSFFESDGFNGCWCLRTLAEIPKDNVRIRLKIQENKKAFFAFVASLVEDNKSSLPKKKREKLSRNIYLLYEGALAESHLQNEAWPIHDSIDVLKTLLKVV